MKFRAPSKGASLRLAAVGVMAASGLAIAGSSGIFAGLTAEASNTTPQQSTAGTLELGLNNNGNGFSQAIANIAPNDTVNRFVTLTNTGNLDSINPGLKIAATGTPSLITDGRGSATNKALTVEVSSCTVAWNTSAGTCADAGGGKVEVAAAPLSTFNASQVFQTLALNSSGALRLRIQVKLPNQDETTSNGTRPAYTVQGGSVNLTYTFRADQRTGITTSS